MSHDSCPRCDATLKVGMLSSNQAFTESQLALINLWTAEPLSAACNKCGDETLRDARKDLGVELIRAQSSLRSAIASVPILSLQSPVGWIYRPIGVVTAQTVTGTGMFSDVASAFTDLFGTQSGTYNAKIREGENICQASLRSQAIELGGNAVLAVDIDYAEVGGQRAMLMVCMTGTVVDVSQCQHPLFENLSLLADAHQTALRARKLQDILNVVSAGALS
jgi:uncharacterized protein YbjQ (UPF0145 family)